jgi:hypothetical protein
MLQDNALRSAESWQELLRDHAVHAFAFRAVRVPKQDQPFVTRIFGITGSWRPFADWCGR